MKILKFLPFLLFISGLKSYAIFDDLTTPMSNRGANGHHNDYSDIDMRAETDFLSFTPLHLAAVHEPTEGIKTLIAGGADVNATTKVVKFTPLHLAAKAGRIDNMKVLIANGAKVNAKTRQEFTPLHFAAAAHTNTLEAVELLSSQDGVEIDARTDQDYTPLLLAVLYRTQAISFFLKAGANVNAIAGGYLKGLTPFHLAILRTTLYGMETIEYKDIQNFIDAGAHVHTPVASGYFKSFYPIHLATYANITEKIKALTSAKVDIEITTNKGETPLHIAAKYNSHYSAEFLVNAGANLYAKTDKGLTPPRIAKNNPYGYTHLFFKDERRNRRKAKFENFKSTCQRIFSRRSSPTVSQI